MSRLEGIPSPKVYIMTMKEIAKNGKLQRGRVRKEIKTEVSVLTYVESNITLKIL